MQAVGQFIETVGWLGLALIASELGATLIYWLGPVDWVSPDWGANRTYRGLSTATQSFSRPLEAGTPLNAPSAPSGDAASGCQALQSRDLLF
ncbi:hypothetical protein LPKW2_14670 [Lactiplantibacillus pentosus]|nr:hypothetical protein LPKW2_14670 [Lactiplantibacillus pentosus]